MSKNSGSLTIEASVALTAFMFIVVAILSFSTVYKAQSVVSHATLQTSQSLAIESYYREKISGGDTTDAFSKLIKFANLLGLGDGSGLDDAYASLGDSGTDFYKIVKNTFVCSIADSSENADKLLKDVGVVNGLNGIDFSYSAVSNGDIIVNARYKVKLLFSFFGDRTLDFSKSAKTKAFQKISDDNGYFVAESGGSSGGGFRDGGENTSGDISYYDAEHGGSSGGGFR